MHRSYPVVFTPLKNGEVVAELPRLGIIIKAESLNEVTNILENAIKIKMLEKNRVVEKISITDICRKMKDNRSLFYNSKKSEIKRIIVNY